MRTDDILTQYSLNSLRTMARTRHYSFGSLRRPELITALASRLFEPAEVRRMIGILAIGERAALDAIRQAGGRLSRRGLADALLTTGVIDQVGPERPRETIDRIAPTTRNFEELCARLTAHGLLFSEPHIDGTLAGWYDLGPGAVLFAPGPVLDALQQPGIEDAPAAPPAGETAAAAPPVVRGRLIVQPSYSLLVLPPLDPPTLERLSSFAEQVQLAEVAEFRLTQAALYGAVSAGGSVTNIIGFLEARSEQPLPQNVRYTLDAWSRAFEQVRIVQGAALLEGAAAHLDQLQATAELAPYVVRRLTPTRLLLRSARAAEQALASLEEVPFVLNYEHAERMPLQVTAAGAITPNAAANNLLLPVALRRIAEPVGDGSFQLTPQRVRAAAIAAPDGLTGIVKWLRTLAGELPAELVVRLKLWALPTTEIALEQPLLLRLPHELLADLREIPELAPLLADEFQPQSALVRVAANARAELVAALRARGVVLDDVLQPV